MGILWEWNHLFERGKECGLNDSGSRKPLKCIKRLLLLLFILLSPCCLWERSIDGFSNNFYYISKYFRKCHLALPKKGVWLEGVGLFCWEICVPSSFRVTSNKNQESENKQIASVLMKNISRTNTTIEYFEFCLQKQIKVAEIGGTFSMIRNTLPKYTEKKFN